MKYIERISYKSWGILLASIFLVFGCNNHDDNNEQKKLVDTALRHITFLSEDIGVRTAGSSQEELAGNYIIGEFELLNLSPLFQEFTYEQGDTTITSSNVIGIKTGISTKEIIIGAHYDSVFVGQGASDNASGVGLMLAVADKFKELEVPYTIRYIAFGAEEIGLLGSDYYVSQMSVEAIKNTIGMINLDTVIGGDQTYVYSGLGAAGWLREQSLNISNNMGLAIKTNPGLNPLYPKGTTGDWSDHAPFKMAGIDYLNLEATNWEIGDLDGYTQTIDNGEIWHTENDTLAFFSAEYPGRTEMQLEAFSRLLIELLVTLDPPEIVSIKSKSTPQKYIKRDGTPYK